MPTKIIPCAEAVTCPGNDSPFENLTTETPDVPVYWAMEYSQPRMPIGGGGANGPGGWGEFGAVAIDKDSTSPITARGGARAIARTNATNPGLAINSTITPEPADPPNPPGPRDPRNRTDFTRFRTTPNGVVPPNPPTPAQSPNPQPFIPTLVNPKATLFFNDQQTCDSTCPDGSVFTATVPAGTFSSAVNKAAANASAHAQACTLANLQKTCLSAIQEGACVSDPYDQQIHEIGPLVVVSWAVIAGLTPPGLIFLNGELFGTPTTTGTYAFRVLAIFANGNEIYRDYSIRVVEITTSSPLPSADVNVPYSKALVEVGGNPPINWTVVSGALPPGLSLDILTGVISGTPPLLIGGNPNPGGTFTFTVLMQDES